MERSRTVKQIYARRQVSTRVSLTFNWSYWIRSRCVSFCRGGWWAVHDVGRVAVCRIKTGWWRRVESRRRNKLGDLELQFKQPEQEAPEKHEWVFSFCHTQKTGGKREGECEAEGSENYYSAMRTTGLTAVSPHFRLHRPTCDFLLNDIGDSMLFCCRLYGRFEWP